MQPGAVRDTRYVQQSRESVYIYRGVRGKCVVDDVSYFVSQLCSWVILLSKLSN